tara:strand:+ start:442 stop:717 length:276 start_codon:yes stop_codon:yes gene_type:complete
MSDPQKQMSDLFDAMLVKLLKEGRETMTRDGDMVRVEATAADLNVVRQRLKDCGITAIATDDNQVGDILKQMQQRGLKLVDLDDSPDAATA